MRLARLAVPLTLSLLTVLALGRVAATWHVYSPTYDEPYHLAGGVQWLDQGVYLYGEMHPPLARVAMAVGPYLDGYRTQGQAETWTEGIAIINQHSRPARAIALARAGILPFLFLAIMIVFAWTRWIAGDVAGLLAVLAFTSVPPVLAHSGLATTDAAATATIAATLYALVRWLDRPSAASTGWLGVAAGLALLAKMSALLYLPVAGTAILFAWISAGNLVRPYFGRALAAGFITFLTLWAGYRFSVGPIHLEPPGQPVVSKTAASYPAPEFPRGFHQMLGENAKGRRSYLLGKLTHGGRWYYFPIALGVKTPIPFLLLAGIGGATLLGMARRRRLDAAPVLAAGAILITALPANLNIGVRHILPIYPMLAICAGVGVQRLWRWGRPQFAGALVAVALSGWLVTESVRAHPDYLPYFNQLAGNHPERILVSGDLDWGQDLGRLVDTLRARKIQHLSLSYFGKADLSKQGLPPFTELQPNTPVTGWVAASVYSLWLGAQGGQYDAYAWLRRHTPVARVGRSILLYYIDP